MTRDGLTEENLHDGTVKDISHKSRGRPTDDNAGVESARFAEREAETAIQGLRHAQIRSRRTDVKTYRRGYRESRPEYGIGTSV